MKSIKKMVLVSAFAGTCLAPHAQTTSPAIPADPAIEANIREMASENDSRTKDRSDV